MSRIKRNWTKQEFIKAEAPIIEELTKIGIKLKSLVYDNVSKNDYEIAIPILLKWFKKSRILGIKGSILRILTNNPHKGMTDKFLLNIYATWPINIETSLKWEIGNALAETASKDSVKDIIDLIKDKRHGTDREMLAIALGNIGDKTAIPFLISCLDDEDITGHVVIALGKLKAIEALDEIKRLSNHEKSWIRQEVKRAIRKIEKEIDKQSS